MYNISENLFDSKPELAAGLASDIASRLANAIEKKGAATLAVSGGSTPKLLFKELSRKSLDWEKVTVVLVDERYVPPTDSRSNEKLVRENLVQNQASTVKVLGFWLDDHDISQASTALDAKLKALGKIDIAIFGMGLDGHTASFFPGGSNLEAAMNPSCSKHIIDMEAEGAGEPRLTLTLPPLASAECQILHIEGDEKRQVLQAAMSDSSDEKLPIRIVIEALEKPMELYWAP